MDHLLSLYSIPSPSIQREGPETCKPRFGMVLFQVHTQLLWHGGGTTEENLDPVVLKSRYSGLFQPLASKTGELSLTPNQGNDKKSSSLT